MLKAAMTLIAGLVALAATPAMAQDSEFIGFVPKPVDPSIGVNNLHNLCATMFLDAYMCETGAIIGRQLQAPFPVTDRVWIRPTIVAGDATAVVDASGNIGTLADDFTCDQWTDNRTAFASGLVMAHMRASPEAPDVHIFSTGCGAGVSTGLACCADRVAPRPKK